MLMTSLVLNNWALNIKPTNDSVTDLLYNFNDWNTNGSFTMADLNLFLSALEILLIAQKNKYFGIFWRLLTCFVMKMHVVCIH